MKKNFESPESAKIIKKEMATKLRFMVIVKTFSAALFMFTASVLIILFAEDGQAKTYSLITFLIVFFVLVLFYGFCPIIISKKFQLTIYIKELDEVSDSWDKQKELHISGRTKCLNEEAMVLNPFPEIVKCLNNMLSQSVKLTQNIDSNYEFYVNGLVDTCDNLSFRFLNIKQENDLFKSLKTVSDSVNKDKDARLLASASFLEACKDTQNKVGGWAIAHKNAKIEHFNKLIEQCEKSSESIKKQKNQAVLMLENL